MNTKKIILFIDNPFIIFDYLLRKNSHHIKSDELFVKLDYFFLTHKTLNLRHPQTFNEKLSWLKLHDKHPEFSNLVDKYESKKFVAKIIGQEHIIPTFGIWEHYDDIDFGKLPNQFVLKCTHDSQSTLICKNKDSFDFNHSKDVINKGLKWNFFWSTREYPYKTVKPRIIAEQFMVNGNDEELKDYKFYCFNGKAEYCQLIANRSTHETIDFYDREWKHQDFIGLNPHATFAKMKEQKPTNYQEMLSIADQIASKVKTPFVRIDLYNINKKIYFGEITFFPMSGVGSFRPKEWDYKLGQLIKLNQTSS